MNKDPQAKIDIESLLEEAAAKIDSEVSSGTMKKGADGSVSVTLLYPFEHDLRQIKELTLRRPKARDIARGSAKADDIEKGAEIIAAISGVKFDAVMDLDSLDFERVQGVLAWFRR